MKEMEEYSAISQQIIMTHLNMAKEEFKNVINITYLSITRHC